MVHLHVQCIRENIKHTLELVLHYRVSFTTVSLPFIGDDFFVTNIPLIQY